MKTLPKLKGFTETIDNYYDSAKAGQILRLGVQLSTPACNWNCPYCYAELKADRKKNSSVQEIKQWIDDGTKMGVTAVTINGTFEPTTSEDLFPVLEHCRNSGLTTLLVTNSSMLTAEKIRRLKELDISVLLKLNVPISKSTDPLYNEFSRIQAKLAGKAESSTVYSDIISKLNLLMDAGFNEERLEDRVKVTQLGVESVITNFNIAYLPELAKQLREKNIYAHFEVIKEQGRCQGGLIPQKADIQHIFEKILAQDIADGYRAWEPKPPYVAGTCYQNLIRLNVAANGDVSPCPGIELTIGNLQEQKLSDLTKSDYLQIIRNLHKFIQGDCKDCEQFSQKECYGGCRGTVFQELKKSGFSVYECLTGSDPLCWRVQNILDKQQ